MSKTFGITFERPKGSRKKGKKNRKYGRNERKCEAYRKAQKHEKSHVKRLTRHLVKFPQDEKAVEALRRYECVLKIVSGK